MKKILIIIAFMSFFPVFSQTDDWTGTHYVYFGTWMKKQDALSKEETRASLPITDSISIFYKRISKEEVNFFFPAVIEKKLPLSQISDKKVRSFINDLQRVDRLDPKILLDEDGMKVYLIHLGEYTDEKKTAEYDQHIVIINNRSLMVTKMYDKEIKAYMFIVITFLSRDQAEEILNGLGN